MNNEKTFSETRDDLLKQIEEEAKNNPPPKKKSTTGKKATKVEETEEIKIDPEKLVPKAVSGKSKAHKELAAIEARFMEVAGLKGDLTHFPIDSSSHLQVKTDKKKSDAHGEVFTPLWLVDEMIEHISVADILKTAKTYRDLCSGYGQFTIRLLRRKVNLLGAKFNINEFLYNYHHFVEIQPNSCYRLIYIFGESITLSIGDATLLKEMPDSAEHGIWVWVEKESCWKDMTAKVLKKFNDIHDKGVKNGTSIEQQAEQFENWFKEIQQGS